ncbi:uncharacterized protein LOC126657396 [Mercurialis annua]|uniref:uncharacterized protein LOC126657396 n=1 Tax=Mercurialis annua TaxID=3986 RepID=UPI00215EE1F9|nr:uncharacterized protein LOC126657396 [Mercurialis annua]XP_050208028.1 uncharacterized protein LOC126657396 [Mercurialis annua]
MERHIENFLHKLSIICIIISTILLLHLYFQTPATCVSPTTPITKPHLKFPTSTCDPSLLHQRPHLPLSKKNQRLWSSHSWLTQLSSYTAFFTALQTLNLLHNHSKVICVSAGAGQEVMALNELGVADVTGVEVVDALPLVKKADPSNLPFFDGVFDVGFSSKVMVSLFPLRFVGEMERSVRVGGVCVLVVEECGESDVREIVGLFGKSRFVGAQNVSLIGTRMTRIIMRVVGVSSSSSTSP